VNFVLIDIVCFVVVLVGIGLLIKRPQDRSERAVASPDAHDRPETYIRRIAGVMAIAFGLALGVMMTVFHFT